MACSYGEVSEEGKLCEGACVIEVCEGLWSALAGQYPFFVLAQGLWEFSFGEFEVLHLRLRDEPGAASKVGHYSPFFANVDSAVCGKFPAGFKLSWSPWEDSAIIPGHCERGHVIDGTEFVADKRSSRIGFLVEACGSSFDGDGPTVQAECPKGEVHDVASHVSDSACTEIPPAAPCEGYIGWVVWSRGCRAEPEVPIECFGYRWSVLWAGYALCPEDFGPDGPDMHFADMAYAAGLEDFDSDAEGFAGMMVYSHLCHDICVSGGLGEQACFVDGVGEGFFAINVLTHFDGHHGGDGVGVVRGGDDDGVDVFFLVEHSAEVAVLWDAGVELVGFGCPLFIDVAKSDDVFRGELSDVSLALTAGTDKGDVELFARGDSARTSEDAARDKGESCCGGY